jgi:hypothetical protein
MGGICFAFEIRVVNKIGPGDEIDAVASMYPWCTVSCSGSTTAVALSVVGQSCDKILAP